jgi:hypothetical protein
VVLDFGMPHMLALMTTLVRDESCCVHVVVAWTKTDFSAHNDYGSVDSRWPTCHMHGNVLCQDCASTSNM